LARLDEVFLWSAIIACADGFFLLLRRDPLDFVVNTAWGVTIYSIGYRNLREGRTQPAKAVALVSAFLAGIGLILSLRSGDFIEAMFSVPIFLMLAYASWRL
jgi:CHASE2 domain-containing sensor protein